MELRLVDITPSPDDGRKPAATSPVPDNAVVDNVAAAPVGDHLELPPLMLIEEISYAPIGRRPTPDLRLVEESAPKPAQVSATTPDFALVDVGAHAPMDSAAVAPSAAPAKNSAAVPVAIAVSATTPPDPFVVDARREYEDGHVDQPLWAHAVAQHGDDEPQAMATYLRARATALKLERRQRRTEQLRTHVHATGSASHVMKPRLSRVEDDDDADEVVDPPSPQTGRKVAFIAAPIAVVVAIAAWWMLPFGSHDTDPAKDAGAANVAANGTNKVNAQGLPGGRPSVRPATEVDPAADLAEKVQALKTAGNWNVMVLYATEWTRKQPANATAWKELSIGYTNLRQWNDAVEAGKKAVQLAPSDPLAWRNLGQVNLDVKESEAALQAFERAAALQESDPFTLLKVGALNAQLDRLPQARAAFDRVLEASPDNLDALCGTALVAQRQGRGKDAEAIVKQLHVSNQKCPEVAAVAVAPAVAVPVPVPLSLSNKKLR